jgi:UDP-2,3-diacylglucosamine hydrolase
MKAIFISDAHLRKSSDERYKKLMNFFDTVKEGNVQALVNTDRKFTEKTYIDDLYIAGDLFDFWFCQKEKIHPEFKPVINKLIELQKAGIRVHLSEGNHDFFMGEYFHDVLGMEVFEEMTDAKLDKLHFLIAHGDTADSANIRYILFRNTLRSRVFYNIQRFIPASIRWTLAGLTSTASKELTVEDGDALVKKMAAFALDKFKEGYDAVIHYSFLYYEDDNFFLRHYRP